MTDERSVQETISCHSGAPAALSGLRLERISRDQDLGREGGADDARKELEDATEASGEVLPPPPLLYLLNYLL